MREILHTLSRIDDSFLFIDIKINKTVISAIMI